MGAPTSVVRFLGRLLEVHHTALVLASLGTLLPGHRCALRHWLCLADWHSLLDTGGRLLLTLAVHPLELVVPDLGGLAVAVVDLYWMRVRLESAVLPSQLLAVDVFPERGLGDPHLLARVLLLVDALRLHLHLGDGDGARGAVLLVEELSHHLRIVLDGHLGNQES